MGKLTAVKVKNLRELGAHAGGDRLYLLIRASGDRSWILRVQAAERLAARGMTDLGYKWLSDQCDRGLIPYVVVARKRRVRSDVLEAMIN